jgi:Ca2+/Na+ antiporter
VSETLNSNTINLLFGVSIPALFVSFGTVTGLTRFNLAWLLVMTAVVLLLLAPRGGLRRWSGGAAILLLYAVFVVVQIAAST